MPSQVQISSATPDSIKWEVKRFIGRINNVLFIHETQNAISATQKGEKRQIIQDARGLENLAADIVLRQENINAFRDKTSTDIISKIAKLWVAGYASWDMMKAKIDIANKIRAIDKRVCAIIGEKNRS